MPQFQDNVVTVTTNWSLISGKYRFLCEKKIALLCWQTSLLFWRKVFATNLFLTCLWLWDCAPANIAGIEGCLRGIPCCHHYLIFTACYLMVQDTTSWMNAHSTPSLLWSQQVCTGTWIIDLFSLSISDSFSTFFCFLFLLFFFFFSCKVIK